MDFPGIVACWRNGVSRATSPKNAGYAPAHSGGFVTCARRDLRPKLLLLKGFGQQAVASAIEMLREGAGFGR
jgi:hypothetical protein